MIKKIQLRFILFTMLVIALTMGILFLLFTITSKDTTTNHRTAILAVIILVIVLIASITLSYYAISPIKKAWQQQLDFTADASHELRTPLAVIQSSLEILMEDPDSKIKDQIKWVSNIHKETMRLNKLVDDLLTLSRADSEEIDVNFTDFPLKLILDEQLAAFEAIAAVKEIEFINNLSEDLIIHADANRLSQLFRILIDNSMKYMGRPGCIDISAVRERKNVKITYKDNGIGIPTEDIPNVLKRFYRVNKSRTRQKGGSGLGLAIAKWIVEAHNGTISVQSGNGKGVIFTIIIK